MQHSIFKKRHTIMVASGILIAIAFIAKWTISHTVIFTGSLIIASILGALPIMLQAYQALSVKVISIDVLVTLAVVGAFLIQNYEESAIVTFLFLFGAYLEQKTLNKTRSAIKELTEMAPENALIEMSDGEFKEVAVETVKVGDTLLVKTGAKIPTDGTILSGQGFINEASITGESALVNKRPTAKVFAGTILENGTIQLVADQIGKNTIFAKIIALVEEAQDSKSDTERFIDRFSNYYTPAILVLAIIVWILSQNIELAITILVLGCPGALVIGVPVSNVAGIGNGARHGILLKGSDIIHDFSHVDTIIFDKTGTLTTGNPTVAKAIYYADDVTASLSYLASIEHESDHPLAKAVLAEIGDVRLSTVERTTVIKGEGISAYTAGHRTAVGNPALMKREGVVLSQQMKHDIQQLEDSGHSLVLVAVDGMLQLMMGIRDTVRKGAKEELQKLNALNVKKLVMLSGDNQGTVDLVSQELGLTESFGNMLPEDKSAYVQQLKDQGEIVAFVGDGVNDSPSIALANVGIAMGSGTDVAIETSDVVLMHSDLSKIPHALGLTKATARNMFQNILISIGVVFFLLLSVLFSQWMTMSIGMLLHEGSILLVILNGMRLAAYK